MFSLSQRRPAKDGPSVEVQPGRDESHPSFGVALWLVQRVTGRETSRGSFRFPRGILRLRSEQSGDVVPPPTASRPTRPGPRFGATFRYRTHDNLPSRKVAAGYFGDDSPDAGGRFGTRSGKPAESRAIFVATGIIFEEVPPSFDSEPRQTSVK